MSVRCDSHLCLCAQARYFSSKEDSIDDDGMYTHTHARAHTHTHTHTKSVEACLLHRHALCLWSHALCLWRHALCLKRACCSATHSAACVCVCMTLNPKEATAGSFIGHIYVGEGSDNLLQAGWRVNAFAPHSCQADKKLKAPKKKKGKGRPGQGAGKSAYTTDQLAAVVWHVVLQQGQFELTRLKVIVACLLFWCI